MGAIRNSYPNNYKMYNLNVLFKLSNILTTYERTPAMNVISEKRRHTFRSSLVVHTNLDTCLLYLTFF